MGARAGKKELTDNAKIHATVFLGHPSDPNLEGFGLRVELTVEGCPDDSIIQAAHEVRTFSVRSYLVLTRPPLVLPLQPRPQGQH